MKAKVTIDRIEEGIAIIELDSDNYIDIPLKYLPDGVKEGVSSRLNPATKKRIKCRHFEK